MIQQKPFHESRLSVVTPVYNNRKTLETLSAQIFAEARKHFRETEYIFVNDASPDDSQLVLRKLASADPRIKVIQFARNFGQHVAQMAGLGHVTGDYVLFIDADLEEPPSALSRFVEKMREGHEIVIGKRSGRRPSWFKTLTARLYSIVFNALSSHKIIDNTTSMRLMTRKYAGFLTQFHERPFIGGMTSWIGIPPALVELDFVEQDRTSSYTLAKMLSHARVGLLGFSVRPLRVALMAGGCVCGATLLFALKNLLRYLILRDVTPGYTSITLLFFLIGVQFIFIGIMGEYVGEIFLQTKGRPPYLVYEKLNFEE